MRANAFFHLATNISGSLVMSHAALLFVVLSGSQQFCMPQLPFSHTTSTLAIVACCHNVKLCALAAQALHDPNLCIGSSNLLYYSVTEVC